MTKQEIEKQYSYYFYFDKPIEYIPMKYKKDYSKILKIYPFKMEDYFTFNYISDSLHYDRYNESNVEALRMNYLNYIMYLGNQKFKEDDIKYNAIYKFLTTLSMALNIDINNIKPQREIKNGKEKYTCIYLNYKIGLKKVNDIYKDSILIKDNIYEQDINCITTKEANDSTKVNNWCGDYNFKNGDIVKIIDNKDSDEFIELRPKDIDNICQLIMYQNIYEYDDSYMCKEMKEDIEEANRIRNKNNGKITLERQMFEVYQKSNLINFEDINNLSIRKFYSYLSFVGDEKMWTIRKTGEMSGMVTFKDEMPHYLSIKDDSNPTSLDNFKNIAN